MADNLTITPGAGATLLTDEKTINGETGHAQRVTLGAGETLAHNAVSCTGTATLIKAANYERASITVRAIDGTVYIGGASVTSSTGFPIYIGESYTFQAHLGAVYGITSSGTTIVRYIEES